MHSRNNMEEEKLKKLSHELYNLLVSQNNLNSKITGVGYRYPNKETEKSKLIVYCERKTDIDKAKKIISEDIKDNLARESVTIEYNHIGNIIL